MGEVIDAAVQVFADRLADDIRVKRMLRDDETLLRLLAMLADKVESAVRAGGKVIFFGNGGSSMDAGHLAAELLGRFYFDRPSLPAMSLADNTAAMTAIGNDYSYNEVFSRQVSGVGKAGDVLVGLSTSGNSPNVINALVAGRQMGIFTAAFTGETGGDIASVADICIRVPSTDTPRVQEACMHLGHTLCEILELNLFREAYA